MNNKAPTSQMAHVRCANKPYAAAKLTMPRMAICGAKPLRKVKIRKSMPATP
jgi:hypothetical protein